MLSIVEETRVSDALHDACLKWPRADEAWDAVTWALMRDPTVGRPLIEGGALRLTIWAGAKSIGMPDIRITYRITEVSIEILDAVFTESTHTAAGSA